MDSESEWEFSFFNVVEFIIVDVWSLMISEKNNFGMLYFWEAVFTVGIAFCVMKIFNL